MGLILVICWNFEKELHTQYMAPISRIHVLGFVLEQAKANDIPSFVWWCVEAMLI